ncbi:MAG: rod shape-determining protein RodA [Gammaproteobacteria bacterium]|jgi:rod shape determining protein RodA
MKQQTFFERVHVDVPLVFGLVVLCLFGLLVLYSASGQEMGAIYNQSARMLFGFGLMFLVAQISPSRLAGLSIWIFLFGVILLILVLVIGYIGKGAQRWLDLGVIRFQPSELMKLAVPMVLSWYLAEKTLPPSLSQIFLASLLILVPVMLIVKQPDLGTAILVSIAGFSVLFIAGMSWRYLAGLVFLGALLIPVSWLFMYEYQRQRVMTFINPEQDPLGAGYHIIQSMIAIGSGGLYGKGWLNGTQSHLEFLPERSTDFIFAVLCEEFGFTGVFGLLALYLFIIYRGLYISMNAQQAFGKILGASIILTFFVYIIVNIGMVSGQLPVVGIPLPLISYGGTSMVTLMIGFGVIMAIHTNRRFLSD